MRTTTRWFTMAGAGVGAKLLALAILAQGASAAQTTGGVASASLSYDNNTPDKAFDGIKAADDYGNPSARYSWSEWPDAVPQWLQYEFDNPKMVTNYSIFCSDHVFGGWSGPWMPKSWTFEGQAAGSPDWVVLDTQTDGGAAFFEQ